MGRPKLNRTVLQARVNPDTPERLKQMALKLGFQWGAEGNTGAFLDAIALLPDNEIEQLIKLTLFCQTPKTFVIYKI